MNTAVAAPKSSKAKALNFRDLEEKKTGAIWVLNTSKGEGRSEVMFTVAKVNGRDHDTVVIPITWLPIDLTQQVTRKQLMESSDFRKGIVQGNLTLVADETAQTLHNSEGATEEAKRLQVKMSDFSTVQSISLETIAEAPTFSTKVLSIIQSIETSSEIEVINTLRNAAELTEEDFRAIRKKTPKTKKKLRLFLKEAIENAPKSDLEDEEEDDTEGDEDK